MERFVIGTGRCGSTLLSTMLSKHPQLLVLSEFFGGLDRRQALDPSPIKGTDFGNILQQSNPIIELRRRRNLRSKEVLFDISSRPAEEWAPMPILLAICMPFLSSSPGELLEACVKEARTWPERPIGAQYNALFGWLQARFGKRFWLERSGTSFEYLPDLHACFPEARFLHIHRDGREAALSMREHTYFQLVVTSFFDPPSSQELQWTENDHGEIGPEDPILYRMTRGAPPPERFGEFWTWQVMLGLKGVGKLDARQYLSIAFEELVRDPRRALNLIGDFFELPGREGWVDDAIALVHKGVPTRFHRLPPAQQEALDRACFPGRLALGQVKSDWIYPTIDRINALETDR
jgi:putative sulfotransferase